MKPSHVLGYGVSPKLKFNLGCIEYGQTRTLLMKIPISSLK